MQNIANLDKSLLSVKRMIPRTRVRQSNYLSVVGRCNWIDGVDGERNEESVASKTSVGRLD